MPPVIIAAVPAIAGAAVAGFTTASIALAALTIASSALSYMLSPKPPSLKRQLTDNTVTTRQAAAPQQLVFGQAMVAGIPADMVATDGNQFLHIPVLVAGHEIEGLEALYFGDEEVPLDGNGDATGDYAGFVRALVKTGTATQTAFAELITETGGRWTATDTLSGLAVVYVRLKFDADVFPNNIPNLRFLVNGWKAYDPRVSGHDPDDATTWEWTDNPAILLASYLCDTKFGLGADYATEIDETALIAAANVCDETVTLAAGGTEKRYTLNGSASCDAAPREIIQDMLGAMSGRLVYSGGVWLIKAGAYEAPTITLTADDFVGPVTVRSLVGRRQSFNAVKGVFRDPERDWQATNYPAITSATFEAEDNGERVFADIDLPFTNTASMAQRLAKIGLRRARQQISVEVRCSMAAWQLVPGDTVALTFDRYGWASKVFDVVNVQLRVESQSEDGPAMSVDLSLRETASTVFDWSVADEGSIDPAPNTQLPNPFIVSNPSALQITTEDVTVDTVTLKRPRLNWTVAADQFVVSGGQYEVAWRPVESPEVPWRTLPPPAGDQTQVDLPPVEDGTSIDVRIRSVNSIGVRAAAFVEIHAYTIGGAASGPASVDYGSVAGSASATVDYGAVSGTPGATVDYGSV
ncbi:MAG: phage tail protein [Pseudomonadota bacterium]|nr:phage tail protein [Pseudomonadota bacterium]